MDIDIYVICAILHAADTVLELDETSENVTTLTVTEGDSGSTRDVVVCITTPEIDGSNTNNVDVMILPSSTSKGKLSVKDQQTVPYQYIHHATFGIGVSKIDRHAAPRRLDMTSQSHDLWNVDLHVTIIISIATKVKIALFECFFSLMSN